MNLTKFILLIFLPLVLNAQVALKAPDTFYKNDVISFSIVASGSEINIPDIKSIDGNSVQTAGTSQQTTIINGKRSYKIVKQYAVTATKDITIPSFKITVDGKIEKTQSKNIKMLMVEKTKSDLYDLTITTDKKEVYVGEAVVFILKFKYKKDLQIVSLDYKKPDFENFWVKELKPQAKQDNDVQYVEQEIRYLLFPQKAGGIELGPLKIGVATVKNSYGGSFYLSTPTITTPVYSNKVQLKVKALPQGIKLIGDFDITSTVDKMTVNQGEAVSYKLYINGRGNIDDLDEVIVEIPDATIYDNPSNKEYNIQNNLYGGKYSKIYSIVAKKDFTIPSIKINYFDKNTQKIKTIQTKSYDIKVKGEVAKAKTLEVQSIQKVVDKTQNQSGELIALKNNEKVLYLLIGLVVGICLMILYGVFRNGVKKNNDTPLMKLVKKSKSPNELFKVLVVYINIDEELDKIIYKLEQISINEFKIEKKNINKILKNLFKDDIK
jgi:hypothetical protein